MPASLQQKFTQKISDNSLVAAIERADTLAQVDL